MPINHENVQSVLFCAEPAKLYLWKEHEPLKKRIFSFLIVLALVLTMIPLQAKAASAMVASQQLIEVLKKVEGFSAKPVWDYSQWSVGYGTRAPDEHLARYQAEGISEEEATQLLMNYMDSMGRSVNSFIDKFGLTLTQAQFDALLSFTYNCGSRWMMESSNLRTAIVNGSTGNDLLYAFARWSSAGGTTLPGLIRRRMSEANMYLNGVYDPAPPANFCYVNFDPNGGECEVRTQAFIAGTPENIRASASFAGCQFQGWYTDPTGGEKVEQLDESLNGYMLYAHWSAGEGAGNPQETPETTISGTPVSYTKQIASATLNVFDQPVKGAMVLDALMQYDVVDIVEEYSDSTGVKWGKISGSGWINLTYTEEPSADNDQTGVTVKVTGVDVNVRRGPGTSYTAVGKVTVGDVLVITRTSVGGGYTWGRFNKGWIALKYTNYDEAVNGSVSNQPTTQNPVMGTVNVNEFLRIRSAPGVGNPVVGNLGPRDRVQILEQKAVGGTIWGRIDKGWISLDYVILDKAGESAPETTPEPAPQPAPQPENTAVTGKIKLTSGRLNIRTGPSTGYSIAGKYNNGAAVTILEQKTVGTVTWGRTDKGWISLAYVQLDQAQTSQPTTPSTPEPQPEQTPAQPATGETGTVSLTSGSLRIRSGAGTNNAIVGNLYNGAKVTITERKTVGSTVWGKMEKGWISLDYVKFQTSGGNTTTGTTTTPETGNATESTAGTIKLTSGTLRVRNGAGTNHAIVGYLRNNDKVTITDRKTVGGTVWGRIDKGWISLDYVVLDGQTAPESTTQTQGTPGTVTGTGLRIRSGAGTNNRIVGSLTIGDKVTILETTTVNGTQWGRIAKGWICMDYVKTN